MLKRKYGFTLIELLAVIVILGILLLIAFPTITSIIEDAQKGSFRNSVLGYIKTAEMEYSKQIVNNKIKNDILIVFANGNENATKPDFKLEYKGTKAQNGIMKIETNGNISVAIHNGRWCATKKSNDNDVVVDDRTFANCTLPITVADGWIPVANAQELNQIRNNGTFLFGKGTEWEGMYEAGLDKNYVQVANIDMNEYSTGEGWQPIGNSYDKPFVGNYNGSHTIIKNLTINNQNENMGLFGVTNANLENVILANYNITNRNYSGSLFASMLNGTIQNSFVIGNITGQEYSGGLVGFVYSGDIFNTYSHGNISGTNNIGGLIGFVLNENSKITNVGSIGNVSGNSTIGGLIGEFHGLELSQAYFEGSVAGKNIVGGLLGAKYEETGKVLDSYSSANVTGNSTVGGLIGVMYEGNVSKSYSTGDVKGTNNYIGGFVGGANGTIDDCYTTSSVEGIENIGGFIGGLYEPLEITNSYATGRVKGEINVGGFTGWWLCWYGVWWLL